MKKKGLLILSGVICLALVMTGLPVMAACAKPAPTPVKPIELDFAHQFSSVAGMIKLVWQPWVDEIEKRTEGRVKIVQHYSSALIPRGQELDALCAGLVDIACVNPSIHPGRLATWDIQHHLKAGSPYARFNRIMWELAEKFPEMRAEFAGTKLLLPSSMGGNKIVTTKKPVRTLEDMKGLKFCAVGEWSARQAEALGCTMVTVKPGDFYMALEKGIVDGNTLTLSGIQSFRVEEVIRYITNVNVRGAQFWVAMSEDTWNSLPTDIQHIIAEVSYEWLDLGDEAIFQEYYNLKEAFIEMGIEWIELSPEELARWDERLALLDKWWLEDLAALGLPGKEILAEYHRLLELYPME